MGNKRQRLARKKFRVVKSGDELGKKVEGKAVAVHDGKVTSDSKRFSHDGAQKNDGNTSKKPGSKHPLRVPGMKPGEGCFLCKANDHIAKVCPTKSARDRKKAHFLAHHSDALLRMQLRAAKICLLCRKLGHALRNCPSRFEAQDQKFCYNCGENGHRLAECKKPLEDGGTGFAECFVCKQKGHLSKNCPINSHGIYPKGGSCKLCGGVTHLARDCPSKTSGRREKLQISSSTGQTSGPGCCGKRTLFLSGDDLGDDFVLENDLKGTPIGALRFDSDEEDGDGFQQKPMRSRTVRKN